MSVSHTVGAGAVLTGGPALCGSGLLQLYQGPHHRRQSAGSVPPAGLPLATASTAATATAALLLVSRLRQRLLTLWRRSTPAEKDLLKSLKVCVK